MKEIFKKLSFIKKEKIKNIFFTLYLTLSYLKNKKNSLTTSQLNSLSIKNDENQYIGSSSISNCYFQKKKKKLLKNTEI